MKVTRNPPTGSGARVGNAMCEDPRIDAINFTGSSETGVTIARAAATHLTPTYMELGGNDVCNRARSSGADPTTNMYSATTYRNALKAAIDTLAGCLPQGAVVQVMSMPRVDYLYEAGIQRRGLYCQGVWSLAGICRIVTGETNAARRASVGARINEYNEALGAEVSAAQARHAAKLRILTDWQGVAASGRSLGTYRFTGPDINGADCFHPYSSGQRKLACVAWETGEFGVAANVPSCVAQ